MKSTIIAATLLSIMGLAHAAAPAFQLSAGIAAKSVHEVATAPGHSKLNIVAEGAGGIDAAGTRIRFFTQCAVTDTLAANKVVAGQGDCEFKSPAGDVAYARFETTPGRGDHGSLTFTGGTGAFAGLGAIMVDVTINPGTVGKMVFYIENAGAGDAR